jgi:hypothetical protein
VKIIIKQLKYYDENADEKGKKRGKTSNEVLW